MYGFSKVLHVSFWMCLDYVVFAMVLTFEMFIFLMFCSGCPAMQILAAAPGPVRPGWLAKPNRLTRPAELARLALVQQAGLAGPAIPVRPAMLAGLTGPAQAAGPPGWPRRPAGRARIVEICSKVVVVDTSTFVMLIFLDTAGQPSLASHADHANLANLASR